MTADEPTRAVPTVEEARERAERDYDVWLEETHNNVPLDLWRRMNEEGHGSQVVGFVRGMAAVRAEEAGRVTALVEAASAYFAANEARVPEHGSTFAEKALTSPAHAAALKRSPGSADDRECDECFDEPSYCDFARAEERKISDARYDARRAFTAALAEYERHASTGGQG